MQATLERLRAKREERAGEGGFTLIELLIVIVILGILAAIVVFAVQNLSGKSATSACQSDQKTAETALEAYKAQEGAYPAATDAAALNTALMTNDGKATPAGPWLKDALPTNSAANGKYYFTYTSHSANVVVKQVGSAKATSCAGIS